MSYCGAYLKVSACYMKIMTNSRKEKKIKFWNTLRFVENKIINNAVNYLLSNYTKFIPRRVFLHVFAYANVCSWKFKARSAALTLAKSDLPYFSPHPWLPHRDMAFTSAWHKNLPYSVQITGVSVRWEIKHVVSTSWNVCNSIAIYHLLLPLLNLVQY